MYSKNMDFGGYKNERELIKAASHSAEAKEKLRAYVEPYVRDAIAQYVKKWEAPSEAEEYLAIAGMSAFDRAFLAYTAHAGNEEKPDGHFPLYYIWWARQAAFETFQKMQK